MSTHLYRAEPGRYVVSDGCRGAGHVAGSTETFRFRGIDASHHGFGCVISKYVEKGSIIQLSLGHHQVSFDVMWCESHLGIEGMYRVGLTSSDPSINVEALLSQLGYLEEVTRQAC